MYYLNTNQPYILFENNLKSQIYVDKSMLIEKISKYIRTNNQYICITRPRRFGKTVNANMLGAYYTKGYNSHSLFDNLAISKTDGYLKHMNQYNVIYIDFSRMPDICFNYRDYITNIINGLKEDIFETYPNLSGRTYSMISQLFQDTGESFIFIFDEWDSIFYENFMKEEDKKYYLKFLKGLLKDQPYVELTYMTGILPIAKYSSGSELNMFREYNFMNDQIYEDYFGLNEDEVKKLCEDNKKIAYVELKKWYDGYHMSNGRSLFNPRSVNCAITDGVCRNYWTETGPMNEIADCIEHNIDEVREDIVKLVAGIPVNIKLKGYSVSELQLNTRNEILSAMVVYGFLSYYDGCLQIPNYELMEKYQEVLTRNSMGEVKQIVDRSREMIHATIQMDEEKVAEILEEVHDKEILMVGINYDKKKHHQCKIEKLYHN